jgi:hypothetical protein
MSPWVEEDPVVENPALSLAERRKRLTQVATSLLPGKPRENQYLESVIWADLPVRSAGLPVREVRSRPSEEMA